MKRVFSGVAPALGVFSLALVFLATGFHITATRTALGARTILRLPMQGEIPTLDPGLAEDSSSIEVIEQLFLGLTDFNDDTSEVVPELAAGWKVSADGRVYTFTLRRAKWSDGRPVTAGDIEYAARRNIDPATASPYAFMMYGIRNAEAINKGKLKQVSLLGVKALNRRTIRFTLINPASYFPAVAGLWVLRPLPRRAIEAHGLKWTEPANMVVNGPYRLASWRRGDKLVLRRNPAFYGAAGVRIAEVHYLIVPESSTGLAMYENGEVDMMGGGYLPIPLPDLPRVRKDPVLGKQYTVRPSLCTYYYGFNTLRPPMNNPLVRRAFSAAIDRQLLIDRVLRGGQEVATTFTRPPTFGSVPAGSGVGIGYDGAQARKWLAQAGYPGGKGFPEVVLMYNTSESHSKLAQVVQQMWRRELNVRVRVENQEWKVFLITTKRKDGPHIFRMGWCADYPDANNWLMEVFHPTKSSNRVHWNNAEFAQLTEKAQVVRDPAGRKRLYRRAEQILTGEQAVIAPVYFSTSIVLTKPYLKNKVAPLGGNHIRDWYFTD